MPLILAILQILEVKKVYLLQQQEIFFLQRFKMRKLSSKSDAYLHRRLKRFNKPLQKLGLKILITVHITTFFL